jgi:hypothetical protein
MNSPSVALSLAIIPPKVQEFAIDKGVSRYLNAVIDVARQALPSSTPIVSVGQDGEDETHQYVANMLPSTSRSVTGRPKSCSPGSASGPRAFLAFARLATPSTLCWAGDELKAATPNCDVP